MSRLGDALRERHFRFTLDLRDEDTDWATAQWVKYDICNHDGQAWPCFTIQKVEELDEED